MRNCKLRNSTRNVRELFATRIVTGSPRRSLAMPHAGSLGRGYQNLLNDYEDQVIINQRLKKMLIYLNNEKSQQIKRQTIQYFENDLNLLNKQLSERKQAILDVENTVKLFKKTEIQEYKRPKSPPVLAYRRPSPNIAPCINAEISDRSIKEKIHEDLVSLALYQEREIIVAKLKLELLHDLRDIEIIREKLHDVDNWNEDDKNQINQEKEKIRRLKELIYLERSRIAKIKHFTTERDIAATTIQSVWRGYQVRKGITYERELVSKPVKSSATRSPRNLQLTNRK